MAKGISWGLQPRIRSILPHRQVDANRTRFGVEGTRSRYRSTVLLRAQGDETPEKASEDLEDAESRLERLEAAATKRKTSIAEVDGGRSGKELPQSSWSDWKEGEMLPENWDELNPLQKVGELYTGKRGLLFWMNKFALGSIVAIVILWILFRFVGPQLGLYELRSTISDVSL